jgi:tRNA(fMet)-specific endonuclease VapC
MRAAIDTNRLVDFMRGDRIAVEVVRRCRSLVVPFVVAAELRAGFLGSAHARENEKLLTRFLASARTTIVFPDEDTTHHYARLFWQLRLQGTPIPTNDLWIAALCLQNDLPLFTRDEHFSKIPQLACL